MTVSFKKTALGAIAALTLGLSVATPASAQYYRGGGWGGPGPAVAAGVLGGLAVGAAAQIEHVGKHLARRRPFHRVNQDLRPAIGELFDQMAVELRRILVK